MSFTSTFMANVRTARARHAKYRQTHDELSSLSDRDLTDLGISRSEIGRIAEEAARVI